MSMYQKPPDIDLAMYDLFHQLMRAEKRIFVPNDYWKIEGFEHRLMFWFNKSSLCAEALIDGGKGGIWYCMADEGHTTRDPRERHWGDLSIRPESVLIQESLGRSLQQDTQ